MGKSSRPLWSIVHSWDVKNDGNFFMGGIDPKEAIIWFDDTELVFDHMGCPEWL